MAVAVGRGQYPKGATSANILKHSPANLLSIAGALFIQNQTSHIKSPQPVCHTGHNQVIYVGRH